ncbi:MAG TPA: c-type cytochrome, partial [Panacibacter sp.]|nr:c-type cytochrome [Panacibacter sp.]
MFTTNKKKASIILFLTAFVVFGVAGYTPPKTVKQEGFKNLQVLPKDISKEALDKIMHGYTESLGVKCGFCHVHTGDDWKSGWDFADDGKDEKGIARMMMKMTRSINVNHFNFDNSTMPD